MRYYHITHEKQPRAAPLCATCCRRCSLLTRPTFSVVLTELLGLRAAEQQLTPPLRLTQRPYLYVSSSIDNAAVSADCNGRSHDCEHNSGCHEESIYIQNSEDDNELLIMRTLSDWGSEQPQANAAGGCPPAARAGSAGGSAAMMGGGRRLPQIAEAVAEPHGGSQA
jgi:hypothetical protein